MSKAVKTSNIPEHVARQKQQASETAKVTAFKGKKVTDLTPEQKDALLQLIAERLHLL